MKLLLDENISYRLLNRLDDLECELAHVFDLKLLTTPDDTIWMYAKRNAFSVVTRDHDFVNLAERMGQPPKIIWIDLDNPSNNEIEQAIRDSFDELLLFHRSANDAVFIIAIK